MRISMKTVVKTPEMGISIEEVADDPFWQNMLNTYPYQRMDFKHRLFFKLVKCHILWPIKFLFRIA